MNESQIKQEIKILRKLFFDMYDEAIDNDFNDTDFYINIKDIRNRINSTIVSIRKTNFRVDEMEDNDTKK